MKRGFVIAVGGAAILIAGLSGCSSDEKKPESPSATAAPNAAGTKITGIAIGVDMANPMQPTNKPFELEVACP